MDQPVAMDNGWLWLWTLTTLLFAMAQPNDNQTMATDDGQCVARR